MHLHLRRLSTALVLAFPLVVTATAAGALEASTPDVASGPMTVTPDAVLLEPPSEHEEMSGSEHEESLQEEAEHEEMSDSEHEEDAEEASTGAGHDDGATDGSRPRALVVGSFGLVNAGVVVSAAVLRRRTPDRPKRRPAAPSTALTAP